MIYWNHYRSSIGTQDPSEPPDPKREVLVLLLNPEGPHVPVPDAIGERIADALNHEHRFAEEWLCRDEPLGYASIWKGETRIATVPEEAAEALVLAHNRTLVIADPLVTDRHRNEARRQLGPVYRHKTNPPEDYPEIGVVEVTTALNALAYALAFQPRT